jgi:hypothetical protein
MPILSHSSYLRQRTRWRAAHKDHQTRWRGTPDGRVLTVFRNKRGPGWCWCIGGDGLAPVFGGPCRTREQAKTAVMAAAGLDQQGGCDHAS